MKATEVIRETRQSLFEGKWGHGAYVTPEGSTLSSPALAEGGCEPNCILSHAAKVTSTDYWQHVDSDIVRCFADAIEQEFGEQFSRNVFKGDNLHYVYSFNDRLGTTLDDIVRVTDVAEKLAEQKEQGNG